MDERGLDIGPDADGARGAQAHERHGESVLTRVHAKIVGQQMRDACRKRDISACLFDTHDIGVGGQALDIVLADAASAATGDVVEDARHVDDVHDVGEVMVHALLVGLVVIRRDDEQAVDAELLQLERLAQRLAGAVGARAADHGDAAGDALHDALGDRQVLGVRHRGGLARGTEHEDAVGAVGKVEVDEPLEALEVDAAVLLERGDEGDDGSGKVVHVHGAVPFIDYV